MLGMLIRSMQVSASAHRMRFDHVAALAACKAHVRSVMEYGSVLWSGAAVSHMRGLERLQYRFLMRLGYKTQGACPRLDYESLLKLFDCASIRSRLVQSDVQFLRSVLSGHRDCPDIVAIFSLSAPSRRSRHHSCFMFHAGEWTPWGGAFWSVSSS